MAAIQIYGVSATYDHSSSNRVLMEWKWSVSFIDDFRRSQTQRLIPSSWSGCEVSRTGNSATSPFRLQTYDLTD